MSLYDDESTAALGTVVEAGRGSLPFALIHGEAVVAAAAWALGASGVTPIDLTTPWDEVVAHEQPFVLHDSLCPMTPPDFIAACVRTAVESGRVVVGTRPVSDTVKRVHEDADGTRVGATLDRDALVAVCSPIVLPAAVVAALDADSIDEGADFTTVVADLSGRFEVQLVEAPSAARRIVDRDSLAVLEALTLEPTLESAPRAGRAARRPALGRPGR